MLDTPSKGKQRFERRSRWSDHVCTCMYGKPVNRGRASRAGNLHRGTFISKPIVSKDAEGHHRPRPCQSREHLYTYGDQGHPEHRGMVKNQELRSWPRGGALADTRVIRTESWSSRSFPGQYESGPDKSAVSPLIDRLASPGLPGTSVPYPTQAPPRQRGSGETAH